MADQIADQTICTVTLDSGGTPFTITFEDPGDFQFTIPKNPKTFVQDRGVNTANTYNSPEEQISWSFSCYLMDDQEVDDIYPLLNGTKHMTFVIAYDGGSVTNTFNYVQGTVSIAESDAGYKISMEGTAQGFDNGTTTYGLQVA